MESNNFGAGTLSKSRNRDSLGMCVNTKLDSKEHIIVDISTIAVYLGAPDRGVPIPYTVRKFRRIPYPVSNLELIPYPVVNFNIILYLLKNFWKMNIDFFKKS